MFANSHVKRILEQDNGNESALLLGDPGSGISRNLVVPYHECGNDRERAYNVMFTRERLVIERLIGQWKRRFHILSHTIFAKKN